MGMFVPSEVWSLPCKLLGLVCKLFPMRDIASLSAVLQKIGLIYGIAFVSGVTWQSSTTSACGNARVPPLTLTFLATAFRRVVLRLDGARLRAFGVQLQRGSGHSAILEEVTLMARCLRPRDVHAQAVVMMFTDAMVERLEQACRSAQQLHAFGSVSPRP